MNAREREQFELTIQTVREMTDQNDHSGALVAGTTFLSSSLATRARLLDQLIRIEGAADHGLSRYGYYLHDQMMAVAKLELDPEDFEVFYSSF